MSALDSVDMSLIYLDGYLTTSDTNKWSALFRVNEFGEYSSPISAMLLRLLSNGKQKSERCENSEKG